MVKKGVVFLVFLILFYILSNYYFMNSYSIFDSDKDIVERVIDGDTIVVEGKSVRLLGINTPEKGEKYYTEAKEFLENLVLGKEVKLEKGKEDLDKYERQLRYIFLEEQNVNLVLIEKGFANPYFPSGKDKYSEEFYNAWRTCLKSRENLCEKSKNKCVDCIVLRKINIVNQEIELYNKCSFECNLRKWVVKEEGRKKVLINQSIENYKNIVVETPEFWTASGDSLYLRDEEGKLVLWKSY